MKKIFIDLYVNEFEDRYMMDVKNFAREMLLDASECENPNFVLP